MATTTQLRHVTIELAGGRRVVLVEHETDIIIGAGIGMTLARTLASGTVLPAEALEDVCAALGVLAGTQ